MKKLMIGGAILVALLAGGCSSHSPSAQNTTTTFNPGTAQNYPAGQTELFITGQPYDSGYGQGQVWLKSGQSLHQLDPQIHRWRGCAATTLPYRRFSMTRHPTGTPCGRTGVLPATTDFLTHLRQRPRRPHPLLSRHSWPQLPSRFPPLRRPSKRASTTAAPFNCSARWHVRPLSQMRVAPRTTS